MKKRFSRHILFMLIFIAFAILNAVFYHSYRDESLAQAIKKSQAVLVDTTTNNVVLGKFYNAMEEKNKEVIATAKQDTNHTDTNGLTAAPQVALPASNQAEQSVATPSVVGQPEKKQKVKIALVVTDLGLDRQLTLNALEMPNNVTLGFTPYTPSIEEWLNYAASKGFETLVNVPMQPNNNPVNSHGAYTLLNTLSIEENLARLEAILSKAKKATGIYSHPHESFSKFASNMVPLLSQLAKRNMLFIYGNINNEQSIKSLSEYFKIKLKAISSKVDEELVPEIIRHNLLKLETTASANGYAIGYISSYNVTLVEVKKWVKEVDNEKFIIVPISQLFDTGKQQAS